jgi:hypothetical protein
MVRRAIQFMRGLPGDDRRLHALEHMHFRLVTQFNLARTDAADVLSDG